MRFIPFLFVLLLFSACNHIDIIEDENGVENEKPAINHRNEPLKVNDIINGAYQDETVWVEGYIIGYVKGSNINAAVFASPEEAPNSNFLLADAPEEKNVANIMPVELPKGTKRDALNLYDHPEFLGQKIKIEALVTTYFRVCGLKELYAYEILPNGNSESGGSKQIVADGLISPIYDKKIVRENR